MTDTATVLNPFPPARTSRFMRRPLDNHTDKGPDVHSKDTAFGAPYGSTFEGASSSTESLGPTQPPASLIDAGTPNPFANTHTRIGLRSFATHAFDKTSSAISSLASKQNNTSSSPSLRSSSSSGSLYNKQAVNTSATAIAEPIPAVQETTVSSAIAKPQSQDFSQQPRSRTERAATLESPTVAPVRAHPRTAISSPPSRSHSPELDFVQQRSVNKMHQTSSRLLRMTDEDRPFTRDFKDLFATLVVSLPLIPHRIRFQKIEHTFSSEEAINNLGSLKFSQSNRMPDPKDPSRIVTTTTTTTFSMAKEMARSVCQRFMDARFIESADGKTVPSFPLKNAIWQLTPKGMHVLHDFCQRNGIGQKHVLEVLDSGRNTMQLVILERDLASDKLSHDRATIEVIFRRFVGQDGPNLKSSISTSDSDSLSDYYNGLIGVKMARERKIYDRVVTNTFTGKAAVDWLMDCCTTVDKKETHKIAELFVKHGLIWPVVEDKVFRQSVPHASFQPTKSAIYALTEKGQIVAGWISKEKSSSSDESRKTIEINGIPRDSNTNRLSVILGDPALRLLFREYLRDTHCEENLSFYLDVVEFTTGYRQATRKNTAPKIDTIRETLASAYGLYNAFLAPGSPCELNIDHNLRNSLASRMTRAVGDDKEMVKSLDEVAKLFDQAQTSVFKLMSSDSVPKFLKDSKYSSVLHEHDLDAAVAAAAHHPSTPIPHRTNSRLGR
ncbi:MAG: hypothetical protein M1812_007570 [Candelaria pacifica]|nr:MAG: hypothetical protein M1812_007570 [Candelaria pacifica]